MEIFMEIAGAVLRSAEVWFLMRRFGDRCSECRLEPAELPWNAWVIHPDGFREFKAGLYREFLRDARNFLTDLREAIREMKDSEYLLRRLFYAVAGETVLKAIDLNLEWVETRISEIEREWRSRIGGDR
ncbi:MAG: hypothetical protein BA066_06690 [Candidatus Korarchaeota archaeon NZ13-K]|nr:MAG: hypothetical protein BA066_06690 [Candidatus Korarchaeota archaeon NZ13-K]